MTLSNGAAEEIPAISWKTASRETGGLEYLQVMGVDGQEYYFPWHAVAVIAVHGD